MISEGIFLFPTLYFCQLLPHGEAHTKLFPPQNAHCALQPFCHITIAGASCKHSYFLYSCNHGCIIIIIFKSSWIQSKWITWPFNHVLHKSNSVELLFPRSSLCILVLCFLRQFPEIFSHDHYILRWPDLSRNTISPYVGLDWALFDLNFAPIAPIHGLNSC